MSEAYEQIRQWLIEALAFARGEAGGVVVLEIAVPRVDVVAIRANA